MLEILVVDDEDCIRNFCERALKKKGHNVDLASSGKEAIDKVEKNENRYNRILSDVLMPEMNGVETIKEIIKKYEERGIKKPKIVMMSGASTDYLSEEIRKQLLYEIKKEGYPLLEKPFDIEKFYDAVEK